MLIFLLTKLTQNRWAIVFLRAVLDGFCVVAVKASSCISIPNHSVCVCSFNSKYWEFCKAHCHDTGAAPREMLH